MKITKDTARKFTLKKQRFQHPLANVKKEEILTVLKDLGCVQIDTINVVERSHYLAFWSRLGNYKKEFLDQLLYPGRKIFEYWAHAASIIPLEDYRYYVSTMKKHRQEIHNKVKRWLKKSPTLIDTVLNEIKHNGPCCSKDFTHDDKSRKKQKGGWWNWKPAKLALEILYDAGILMVCRREKFQKYYDLTENVLPSHIDISEPAVEERQCFFLEKALNAWGLAEPRDIGQYFYSWCTKSDINAKGISGLVEELEKQDIIATVQVEDTDKPCLILTKDLKDLEKIGTDEKQANNVSFITPFDNLTWSKPRTEKLFGFHPTLEIYVSKEKRKFGYFALNILYGNEIVGRLDPKMHRDKATLDIKALELREDFKPTKDFEQKLTYTLKSFMKFHNAQTIEFPKTHALPASMVKSMRLSLD